MLWVNERSVPFRAGMRLLDLVDAVKPDADILVVNGFPMPAETVLADGDQCWLIRRGEVPSADQFDFLLHARHTPGVHHRVKQAKVGIMGLGGLGSAVALALARVGVGSLLLVDFDVVEPTNLNRQHYFFDQIGMLKTDALRDTLHRINPHLEVRAIAARLSGESIAGIFGSVDVLVECFDDPAMKAEALRVALTDLKGIAYVGSSGVAGYGDNNAIRTTRLYPRVYLVGDGESAAAPGQGLMAPRVGIAAHQQANQVL
ncbi:MAG: sulfur carrier protein ThiS adenylyltransferase ThiF, partial [Desulfobulbaceae bacterium]|nr:sulfur carrier protein ThiS adenylyltransferase ThiF [Desulfobulbaceae bacterium]